MVPRKRRVLPFALTGALTLVLALIGSGLWMLGRSAGEPDQDPEGDGGALVRLMLAGDSMTHGADGDRTWRYHLWNHLEPHVDGLNFVGPYNAPATPEQIIPPEMMGAEPTEPAGGDTDSVEYRDPEFDQDHNARWGRTLADAATTIGADVAEHRPDVLCVLIGLNDLLYPITAEAMETNIRAYVRDAREANPDIHILFAEALPITMATQDQGFALRLYVYNELVRKLTLELSSERSPVVGFDLAEAESWEVEADTYDGTHPNDGGEIKIAAGFADALAENFGLGTGYPRPLPIAPGERTETP